MDSWGFMKCIMIRRVLFKGWTADPDITGETKEDILSQLDMMKKDCAKTKILSEEHLMKKLGRVKKKKTNLL